MATSSRTRSSGPVLKSNGLQRSISPSGRFCTSSGHSYHHHSSGSAFASSTSSSFSARSTFYNRSASPTRVNFVGSMSPSHSVRFSIDRSISPGRSFASVSSRDQVVKKQPSPHHHPMSVPKRTCMCSPTTHPGSFRCALHKNTFQGGHVYSSSSRLNARRSAMTNSLVRIGTVEGDLVKRALAALIRPSSHQQRRRASFQPRPSRLSSMSKADDLL